MIKFTFAAACLLAAANAQNSEPILLADDRGFNTDMVDSLTSGLTGEDKFKTEWVVPSSFGFELDPEDGEGYQMSANVKRKASAKLRVPELKDTSVLVGKDMLVFRVIV